LPSSRFEVIADLELSAWPMIVYDHLEYLRGEGIIFGTATISLQFAASTGSSS
jgi:hypothetical protein